MPIACDSPLDSHCQEQQQASVQEAVQHSREEDAGARPRACVNSSTSSTVCPGTQTLHDVHIELHRWETQQSLYNMTRLQSALLAYAQMHDICLAVAWHQVHARECKHTLACSFQTQPHQGSRVPDLEAPHSLDIPNSEDDRQQRVEALVHNAHAVHKLGGPLAVAAIVVLEGNGAHGAGHRI